MKLPWITALAAVLAVVTAEKDDDKASLPVPLQLRSLWQQADSDCCQWKCPTAPQPSSHYPDYQMMSTMPTHSKDKDYYSSKMSMASYYDKKGHDRRRRLGGGGTGYYYYYNNNDQPSHYYYNYPSQQGQGNYRCYWDCSACPPLSPPVYGKRFGSQLHEAILVLFSNLSTSCLCRQVLHFMVSGCQSIVRYMIVYANCMILLDRLSQVLLPTTVLRTMGFLHMVSVLFFY